MWSDCSSCINETVMSPWSGGKFPLTWERLHITPEDFPGLPQLLSFIHYDLLDSPSFLENLNRSLNSVCVKPTNRSLHDHFLFKPQQCIINSKDVHVSKVLRDGGSKTPRIGRLFDFVNLKCLYKWIPFNSFW